MIGSRQTALIRCDASTRVGYGHIVRCVALAEKMQHDWQWHVIFAITEDAGGIRYATQHGFAVESLPEPADAQREGEWLSSLVERHHASALILDVRSELPRDAVRAIRDAGTLVVSIDDISERRIAADLAFYPPVPQVSEMDWRGFDGQLHTGWPWIMMPPQFAAQAVNDKPSSKEMPSLLITMGGSDPAGLTLKVLAAIDAMSEAFTTRVVLGAGFTQHDALSDWLANARRPYEILRNPPSMAAVMADADLAIASFGATAYELACIGVPALYLCLSADHARSATALDAAGVAVNLGEHDKVSAIDIRTALQRWLQDAGMRAQAGERARQLIDGLGAARIASAIHESWRVRQHEFAE